MHDSRGLTRRRPAKRTAISAIRRKRQRGVVGHRFRMDRGSLGSAEPYVSVLAPSLLGASVALSHRNCETRQRMLVRKASRVSGRSRAGDRALERCFQKQNALVEQTKTSFAGCVEFSGMPHSYSGPAVIILAENRACLALTFATHAFIVRVVMLNDLSVYVANLALKGVTFTTSNAIMNRDVAAIARDKKCKTGLCKSVGRADQETGTNVREYIYV